MAFNFSNISNLFSSFFSTTQTFEDFQKEALTPLVTQDGQFYKMVLNHRVWSLPSDLSILEISKEKLAELNLITAAIFKSQTNSSVQVDCKKTSKNEYCYTIAADGVLPFKTFLPYNILYNPSSPDMVFCSRRRIGQGGQRNVRLCFDLVTQKYYVRKKSNPAELALISTLKGTQHRGLVQIHKIFKVRTSRGQLKTKFLETCYDQTLTKLLQTTPPDLEQKLLLMEDLLSGLVTLHAIPLRTDLLPGNKIQNYKAFHNDISPKNILVRKQNDTWEAVMTDFGAAGVLNEYGGASGYRSPELLKFLKNGVKGEELISHNAKYGTARDIWAMGVLFVVILASPLIQPSYNVYTLPCIKEMLVEGGIKDSKTAELTQEQVDQDLQTLKASLPLGDFEKIWDVIGLMLRIQPPERVTASEALGQFRQIKSKNLSQ